MRSTTTSEATRAEVDSQGQVDVPAHCLYGAQTQRAIGNFQISGYHLPMAFIRALVDIKWAAAVTNRDLGILGGDRAEAIMCAAEEICAGAWEDQFPLDVFQTGSGTSANMNVNEVLVHRVARAFPVDPPLHPNDDVNLSQSSNDVVPSAIRIAALRILRDEVATELAGLVSALRELALRCSGTIKPGRTHLMDALPVTGDQVFGAFADRVETLRGGIPDLLRMVGRLPLGGTAVGNGVGAPPGFGPRCIAALAERTGIALTPVDRPLSLQAGIDDLVALSGWMRSVAQLMMRLADDIRWLASGPRFGLGEVDLPCRQPGSSIMPDKVNPVIEEAVILASCQIQACDHAVALAGQLGQFELSTTQPLVAYNLLEGLRLTANTARTLARGSVAELRIVPGLESGYRDHPILATLLVPMIGYEAAAALARRARESGRSLREVALADGHLTAETLDRLIDVRRLAGQDRDATDADGHAGPGEPS